MDFIFSGSRQYSLIAKRNGFKYGARLPCTTYFDLHFADQNWKNPDLSKYIEYIKKERPSVATILDWELEEQEAEVFEWAEMVSPFVDLVLFIPKAENTIHKIPSSIGGTKVGLAYSVPTRYGGTKLPIQKFVGFPVHLLGGSPHKQMDIYINRGDVDIVSADGNYHMKKAGFGEYWVWGSKRGRALGSWRNLNDYLGYRARSKGNYIAFDLSCRNIMKAWKENVL